MRLVLPVLLALCAGPVAAGYESQDALAARIEAFGAHDATRRRHAIDVDGCVITTFVWEDWKDHGKVLYSSFHFDLSILVPPNASRPIEKHFHSVEVTNGHIEIVFFQTRKGTAARHEVAGQGRSFRQSALPIPARLLHTVGLSTPTERLRGG